MDKKLYKDYIKVDSDFIPVFSRNSDKIYPNKWQSFYPHDTFKSILVSLVETLEQSSEQKNKSLWMSGAYGTGKTYASFTLKHILEDDISSIESYFHANKLDSVLTRLKGVRAKGDILVVHKSADSNLNTQNKLFNSIVESVKEALNNKYSDPYLGKESLIEKVLTIIKDPYSPFNFEAAFNKYKSRFPEYTKPKEIIEDLETLDLDSKLSIIETIMGIAEELNYNWTTTAAETINWLDDVIKRNNLHSIVFIWDEFTEYFKNNVNNITGLQEIAMASSAISFYFFLITHSDINQLIKDSNAKTVMEARFKTLLLDMPESTAFALMGQALHVDKDLESEWSAIQNDLWDSVYKTAALKIVEKDASIKVNDFKKLLPIHPFSAYLLKYIAKDISSNQRTMFQFLSGDFVDGDKIRENFTWFIDSHNYQINGWNLMTIDYLWDYFFVADNVDFEGSFGAAIANYNNYIDICSNTSDGYSADEKKRVLKALLLLTALNEKNGSMSRTGITSLLRPTLNNMTACFAGTPLESKINSILDYYEKKGMLSSFDEGNGDVQYVISTVEFDKDRMDKAIEESRKEFTFERIVDISEELKPYKPTEKGYLTRRCQLRCVTTVNGKAVASKLDSVLEQNSIAVFYLFVKNETEQGKVKNIISSIYDNVHGKCIVVDFSDACFTDDLYNKYIESRGKERYYQKLIKQQNQNRAAKNAAERCLKDWVRKITENNIRVYKDQNNFVSVKGNASLKRKLEEYDKDIFESSLEKLWSNQKLFDETCTEKIVKMGMGEANIPPNYSYLNYIKVELEKNNMYNDPDYYITLPEHIVSKMQVAVNKCISNAFETKNAVLLTDIWKVLKKEPFGVFTCSGIAFILGFLLKEYGTGKYFFRDENGATGILRYEKLAELISYLVKENKKVNNWFIAKQKPEHNEFCRISTNVFSLQPDKSTTVEDVCKNIKVFLTNRIYPLWALKYYIDEIYYNKPSKDLLIEIIDKYCSFVNPDNTANIDKTIIAEELYYLFTNNPGIEDTMKSIVVPENFKNGMDYYVIAYNVKFRSLALSMNLTTSDYLEMLSEKLSKDSSYLWKVEDTNNQIDNLYTDLKLIRSINNIIPNKKKRLDECVFELQQRLGNIKIPRALVKEEKPILDDLFSVLIQLKDIRKVNKSEAIQTIEGFTDDFLDFYNNQFTVFKEIIHNHLGNNTDDELDALYNEVPKNAFGLGTDEYLQFLSQKLGKIRKHKKENILHESWKKRTGTESPSAWSKKTGIPILCLFRDNLAIARKSFDSLNKTISLPDGDLEIVIDFVNSASLDVLKNSKTWSKAFVEYFADEYSPLIEDNELRDLLRKKVGSDVYNWFDYQNAYKQEVKMLADQKYQSEYRSIAQAKVKSLSATDAQELLSELLEQNPLLGIKILNK